MKARLLQRACPGAMVYQAQKGRIAEEPLKNTGWGIEDPPGTATVNSTRLLPAGLPAHAPVLA